jgi:hypothetical protein
MSHMRPTPVLTYLDGLSSREHSERLAHMIRQYWWKRNYDVDVRVEQGPGSWVVRSDLVNGWPQRKLAPEDSE